LAKTIWKATAVVIELFGLFLQLKRFQKATNNLFLKYKSANVSAAFQTLSMVWI
jgi:hypothetical protein